MNIDCKKIWNNTIKALYYTSYTVLAVSIFANEIDASRVTPYTRRPTPPAATQFDWSTNTRPSAGTELPINIENFGYGNSTIFRTLFGGLFGRSEF